MIKLGEIYIETTNGHLTSLYRLVNVADGIDEDGAIFKSEMISIAEKEYPDCFVHSITLHDTINILNN